MSGTGVSIFKLETLRPTRRFSPYPVVDLRLNQRYGSKEEVEEWQHSMIARETKRLTMIQKSVALQKTVNSISPTNSSAAGQDSNPPRAHQNLGAKTYNGSNSNYLIDLSNQDTKPPKAHQSITSNNGVLLRLSQNFCIDLPNQDTTIPPKAHQCMDIGISNFGAQPMPPSCDDAFTVQHQRPSSKQEELLMPVAHASAYTDGHALMLAPVTGNPVPLPPYPLAPTNPCLVEEEDDILDLAPIRAKPRFVPEIFGQLFILGNKSDDSEYDADVSDSDESDSNGSDSNEPFLGFLMVSDGYDADVSDCDENDSNETVLDLLNVSDFSISTGDSGFNSPFSPVDDFEIPPSPRLVIDMDQCEN